MKHLAVLLAAALFSPVFAAPPKTPPAPKAPKAPKVAAEKGKVKAPGGKNQIGGKRSPSPTPPGSKAIVGPSDSSASKGSVKAPRGEKEAGYVKPSGPRGPGGKAIVGPLDSAASKK